MFNIWCESLLALKAQGLLLLAAVFCSVAVCGAELEAPHLQLAVCSAQELEEARGNSGTVGAIDSPVCDAAWNAQVGNNYSQYGAGIYMRMIIVVVTCQ